MVSGSALPDVAVYGLQHRPAERPKRPWIARWSCSGRQHSRSFRTRAEAERFRRVLTVAVESGSGFDERSGEPASWQPPPESIRVHDWARTWLAEQWPEWAPRTRVSAIEAISRLVGLLVSPSAPEAPSTLRAHLVLSLAPDSEIVVADAEDWLRRWSLPLNELSRPLLALVDQRLGQGIEGQAFAPSTARRFRNTSRACIRRAVELGILEVDPWPVAARERSRRKATHMTRSVKVRSLPDPATMARIIDAIPSSQAASLTYQLMTTVVSYAGLRPSEVVMLRAKALELPPAGWGRINVTEADVGVVGFDEPGEPKTGPRSVPIPPLLVERLRGWVCDHHHSGDDLIFRTAKGTRPTASNWARTLNRATRSCGTPGMRVYDCRHFAATTWLEAGVPLGEVAKRMGHSVQTLVSTYVGALSGDEAIANQRIEAARISRGASG